MIRKIYKEEGIKGYFKGMFASLILCFNPVVQFTLYETFKSSLTGLNGKISNKSLLIASFVSKLITILINYPMLTVKTLYQANSKLPNSEVQKLLIQLFKEEGIQGFYKGLSPKIAGSLLGNAILMIIYERIQNIVRIVLYEIILGKSLQK
jgi:adenine nucleotide transporter 17